MKFLWNIVIFLVLLTVLFLPTISKLQELRSRKDNLERQIKYYRAQNCSLQKELVRLKNDPDYLEAVARDKLKVAKEGEVVYKIEDAGEGKK